MFDARAVNRQARLEVPSAPVPTRTDRLLATRATMALGVAGVRYWSTVAPVVRVELDRWRRSAAAISEPGLRQLALDKLNGESFNAEAAAMLATRAPRAHRSDVAEAIVALQVLFDLLDGLTEQPLEDPLGNGQTLFGIFTDALRPCSQNHAQGDSEGGIYLHELSAAAGHALARLPAWDAVIDVAVASAERSAQAQTRMHAVRQLGIDQLREWAQARASGTGLRWRELTAGAASSVLVVHALIAAAADVRMTSAQAAPVADAYMSVCALLTLLDSVIDEERDERAGELGYIGLYDDREQLAQTLAELARRAVEQTRELPNGAHHVMMLAGVIAYYTAAPDARSERARPLIRQLHRDLALLIAPALAVMRAWRLARGLRARRT